MIMTVQHRMVLGHIKAGLNYAMSLHAIVEAHEQGYAENMYLDSATRTKVEETGGANFLFVTKDGEVVTPKSDSILPSITRRSLVYVAEHYLGLKVTQRPVKLSELGDFAECGLCGTAAVISPVGKVVDHGKEICFPSGMDEMGPVIKKLYDTLTGIQMAVSKLQKAGSERSANKYQTDKHRNEISWIYCCNSISGRFFDEKRKAFIMYSLRRDRGTLPAFIRLQYSGQKRGKGAGPHDHACF